MRLLFICLWEVYPTHDGIKEALAVWGGECKIEAELPRALVAEWRPDGTDRLSLPKSLGVPLTPSKLCEVGKGNDLIIRLARKNSLPFDSSL